MFKVIHIIYVTEIGTPYRKKAGIRKNSTNILAPPFNFGSSSIHPDKIRNPSRLFAAIVDLRI